MRGKSLIQTAVTSRLAARHLQTTAPLPPPTSPLPPSNSIASSSSSTSSPIASSSRLPPHISAISNLPPVLPRPATQPPLPSNIIKAVSLLKSQSTESTGIYLIARLHSRTFLLHPRDIISLPTLKPLQPPGTTLRLTRVMEVGSRDFAIRAPSSDAKILRKHMDWDARSLPNIPQEVAECHLTILEHTRSPQEVCHKFKKRKGYRRAIKSKHGWTRLRVGDIHLGNGLYSGEMEVGQPSPRDNLETADSA